jgi:hypothetical protein
MDESEVQNINSQMPMMSSNFSKLNESEIISHLTANQRDYFADDSGNLNRDSFINVINDSRIQIIDEGSETLAMPRTYQ